MRIRLVITVTLLFGILPLFLSCGGGTSPTNVLLITLDTVRADRMGCYGYQKDITPNMDRLASDGVVFTRAFTPVPITLPSHASILTGTHPLHHGIQNNGTFMLEEAAQTLAEDLKEKGFRTGAVMGAVVLGSEYGLNQGFDYYNDNIKRTRFESVVMSERRGEEVSRLGIDWLEQSKGQPFFLWLHYFDPHREYNPPSPFRDNFRGYPYEGEVAYVDYCVSKVLHKLKEMKILDETLIVVVGDHGEGLTDHDEYTHGIFLYDTTVRVPLIFRYPPILGGGQRIDALADIMDIRPTVLAILDEGRRDDQQSPKLPIKGAVQGVNLLPLILGGNVEPRSILLHTNYPAFNYGWSPLAGIRTEEWKYIHAPKPELYRVSEDEWEEENLSSKEQEQMKKMEAKYWELRKKLEGEEGGGFSRKKELNQDMKEKLKSLGYVWAKDVHKGQEGKDPKDMISLQVAFNLGQTNIRMGKTKQGLMILEKVLEQDPANFLTMLFLGTYYYEIRDLRKAQDYWEKARSVNPFHGELCMMLGSLYNDLNNHSKARELFLELLEIKPSSAEAAYNIAIIASKEKKLLEAEKWYGKALEIDPTYTMARVNLSTLYAKTKRFKEAEEELIKALNHEPKSVEALLNLGIVYDQMGKTEFSITLAREAEKVDPFNVVIYKCLEEWLLKLGRERESIEVGKMRYRLQQKMQKK